MTATRRRDRRAWVLAAAVISIVAGLALWVAVVEVAHSFVFEEYCIDGIRERQRVGGVVRGEVSGPLGTHLRCFDGNELVFENNALAVWAALQWGPLLVPAVAAAAALAFRPRRRPEGEVIGGYSYATFAERVVAFFIDGLAIPSVALALVLLTAVMVNQVSASLSAATLMVGLLAAGALVIGNLVLGEGGPLGQSLGKHLVGLRVVGASGPAGYTRAGMRTAARALSAPFALGYVWVLWDPEGRAWHDRIAGTHVVYAPTEHRSIGYWARHLLPSRRPVAAPPTP